MMIPNWAGFTVQAYGDGYGGVLLKADRGWSCAEGGAEEGTGGGTFGTAKINVSYVNLNTGDTGGTWLRPCALPELHKTQTEAEIAPGAGRVVMSMNITEVDAPDPGALSFPGVATFDIE